MAGPSERHVDEKGSAGRGTRAPDPLITNQVHYQLCYAGIEARIVPGRTG